MFLGQYHHNLDDKGRLTIPARFRELLAGGAYLVQGFDHNLMVVPAKTFEAWSRHIEEESLTNPSARLLRRMFFATATQVEFDRVGRILIPQFLRKLADLEDEVIITGNGNHFELWAAATWEKQQQEIQNAQADEQRFLAFKITAG